MKQIKNIIIILLLFCFLFPFGLKILPIASDRIIQILGIISLMFVQIKNPSLKIKRELLQYISIFLLLAFIALISFSLNNTAEITPIRYMLYPIMLLFAAYFICVLWGRVSFVKLLDFIVIATLLQALISFLFFFYPDIRETVYTYLKTTDIEETALSYSTEFRLIGLGNGFFGGAINYGINLLILTSLPFLANSILFKNKIIYTLIFFVILLAGIMTGRTFFLSIIFSLLLFLYLSKIEFKRVLSLITSIVLFSIIGYIVFVQLNSEGRYDDVFDWAFEIFINYKTSGELTSDSTEVLSTMYIFPDNLKTWLIGDGRLTSFDGLYYMGTDVGFIRMIFAFGIIGTSLLYILWFKIWRLTANLYSNNTVTALFLFIIIFSLVCNIKGYYIPATYFALFLIHGTKFLKVNKL